MTANPRFLSVDRLVSLAHAPSKAWPSPRPRSFAGILEEVGKP